MNDSNLTLGSMIAYAEIAKAAQHVECEVFAADSREHRAAILRQYASDLESWRKQIPADLHMDLPEIGRLEQYVTLGLRHQMHK